MNYIKTDYFITHTDDYGIIYNLPLKKIVKISREAANYLNNMFASGSITKEGEEFLDRTFEKKQNNDKSITESFTKTRKLRRLELMTSTYCNLNCEYCYALAGAYGGKSEIMSIDVVQQILNFIDINLDEINEIQFFGGEPFFGYKAIMYFLDEYSKRVDVMPIVKTVSNFTYLPEEFIPYIIKYNINVTVSLDGPKEINDFHRKYKNNSSSTFSIVKDNITKLRNMGGDIYTIEATYTNKHKSLGISKEYLKQFYLDEFGISDPIICNVKKLGDNCVDEFSDNESIRIFQNNTIDFNTIELLSSLLIHKRKGRFCEAGISLISIFPNGDIYPCHSFALNKSYKFGNIKKSNWYSSDEYNNVINQIEYTKSNYSTDKCDKCLARNSCKVCTADIMIDYDSIDDSVCEKNIETTENAILRIVELKISKNNSFEQSFATYNKD